MYIVYYSISYISIAKYSRFAIFATPRYFEKYTDVCQPNYMVGVSHILYGGGPRRASTIQNTWEKSPLPPPPAAPARPRQRTPGSMHARGKCTELPTEWRGQVWRLTPYRRAILGNIRLLILYLAYGAAGRGPPYNKYEGPNNTPSGVSGCARPLHSADEFVHLPRACMPPGVR